MDLGFFFFLFFYQKADTGYPAMPKQSWVPRLLWGPLWWACCLLSFVWISEDSLGSSLIIGHLNCVWAYLSGVCISYEPSLEPIMQVWIFLRLAEATVYFFEVPKLNLGLMKLV